METSRRWWQFGLLSLLAAVTVVGLLLGIFRPGPKYVFHNQAIAGYSVRGMWKCQPGQRESCVYLIVSPVAYSCNIAPFEEGFVNPRQITLHAKGIFVKGVAQTSPRGNRVWIYQFVSFDKNGDVRELEETAEQISFEAFFALEKSTLWRSKILPALEAERKRVDEFWRSGKQRATGGTGVSPVMP